MPQATTGQQVLVVSQDGKVDAPGSLDAPMTLEAALAKAVTGDIIVMRGGVYRTGDLQCNQGITLQPYRDEQPVLKGTLVAEPEEWELLRSGQWRISWDSLFPEKPAGWWDRDKLGPIIPLYIFNNDMVFKDGEPMKTAGWEGGLDENSYYVDYEHGHIYIATDPAEAQIEISAYDNAMVWIMEAVYGRESDGQGPTIRGISFTQYAYRALEVTGNAPHGPAEPGTYGKDIVGTTLENVSVSHCSRVGVIVKGEGFVMRNCQISDTATEGLYMIAASDSLLERNIFMRNNMEGIRGYYPSAVKIFNQSHRVVCRDNLVLDNENSMGIWWDVGNHDGEFYNNYVENAQIGFFYEISSGATVAGNVFVDCGEGIRSLNSANVHCYNNLLVNCPARFDRTDRGMQNDATFGWHVTSGPGVKERNGHIFMNNVLIADEEMDAPLLKVMQKNEICGIVEGSQMEQCDYNTYLRLSEADNLIEWGPATGAEEGCNRMFANLDSFIAYENGYEENSLYQVLMDGNLPRNVHQQMLIGGLPQGPAFKGIPEKVLKALNWETIKVAGPYGNSSK